MALLVIFCSAVDTLLVRFDKLVLLVLAVELAVFAVFVGMLLTIVAKLKKDKK